MKLLSFLREATAPAANTDWHSTEPWVRFGTRTVTQLCGGLLIGSMLFSISGAVVATGTVSVEGDYKTVQHLEGGIVSKILVHNGDRVKEGQILVQLEDVQARATMSSTSTKFSDYSIQEARLIAERDRKEDFSPPATIDIRLEDNIKILAAQKSLFETKRAFIRPISRAVRKKLVFRLLARGSHSKR